VVTNNLFTLGTREPERGVMSVMLSLIEQKVQRLVNQNQGEGILLMPPGCQTLIRAQQQPIVWHNNSNLVKVKVEMDMDLELPVDFQLDLRRIHLIQVVQMALDLSQWYLVKRIQVHR
jgi:hypothetical protein